MKIAMSGIQTDISPRTASAAACSCRSTTNSSSKSPGGVRGARGGRPRPDGRCGRAARSARRADRPRRELGRRRALSAEHPREFACGRRLSYARGMASMTRTPTDVDRIAEGWVDTLVESNPAVGTYIGRPRHNDRLADFSPVGHERLIAEVAPDPRCAALRDARRRRRRASRSRPRQRARPRARAERRPLPAPRPERHRAPAQEIRDVFDLMPTDDRRGMGAHRDATRGASRSDRRLHRDAPRGHRDRASCPRAGRCARSSRRARRYAKPTTASSPRSPRLRDRPRASSPAPSPATSPTAPMPRASPTTSSASSSTASSQPVAGEQDAVGRELYALQSRHFLGADDRPRRDLRVGHRGARPHGRRAGVHRRARSRPGASVDEAIAFLERTRRGSCTAPTRCSAGCRRRATARSPSSARRSSTSPSRSARSSA